MISAREKQNIAERDFGESLEELQRFLKYDRGTWTKRDYDTFSYMVEKAVSSLRTIEILNDVY